MPQPSVVSVSSSASPMPLLADEEIIFRAKPNFIIPLSLILLVWTVGGLFLLLIINFGALNSLFFISPMVFKVIYLSAFFFVGFIVFLSWLNTEYLLTNKRVEWRFGIIGEKVVGIALEKIQNIVLQIGIIGRIFNFGNIEVEPAGISYSVKFGGISKPTLHKNQIEEAMG